MMENTLSYLMSAGLAVALKRGMLARPGAVALWELSRRRKASDTPCQQPISPRQQRLGADRSIHGTHVADRARGHANLSVWLSRLRLSTSP